MRLFLPLVVVIGCAPGGADAPTYYADVKPIIDHVCVTCHDGETSVAPFPLTTYDWVWLHQDAIRTAVVEERTMPPWLAADGCDDYVGDFSLTEAQITTIEAWLDGGALEGKPDSYEPVEPLPTRSLPRVDHQLTMSEPYVPRKTPDDYRCFVLDWPETSPVTVVTGLGVTPGDAAHVHHVLAFIVPPEFVDYYDDLDGSEDGEPGYTCFGGPGGPADMDISDPAVSIRWLGGWAPGGAGGPFPAGTGIPVEGGSRIILQVHYHLDDDDDNTDPDQTTLDLMVEPGFAREWALIQPFTDVAWQTDNGMEIPANESATHSYELTVDQEFVIHSADLHMHTRGRSATFSIERADGTSDCMLDIQRWDFDWQRPYLFTEPKIFQPGDALRIECTWDNPDDYDVYWGQGTDDEMCLGAMYVSGAD